MIEAAVVGGSGFVGRNILKLLAKRSDVKVVAVTSNSLAGKSVSSGLELPLGDLKFSPHSSEAVNAVDVAFLAVPHGEGGEMAKDLTCKVIDMTADHRLTHTYGLPEVYANEIRTATLVANPGCYATAGILSAYPIRERIARVVFDGISGYSGGGASQKYDYEENIIAYKLANHFHTKEMSKVLGIPLSFTPHVVNSYAGIMITSHMQLKEPVDVAEVKDTYKKFYEGTLTSVVDNIPCSKEVVGTPFCHIGGFEKDGADGIVIISVIDNLLKGAASQAVENMNLMFGLDSKEGLV